jgi:hypothetical protein
LDALRQLNLGTTPQEQMIDITPTPIKQVSSSNLDADDLPDPFGDE